MNHPAPFILAFDTSEPRCIVTVSNGKHVLAQTVEEMAKGQAERLMVLCEQMLDQARVSQDTLSAIGVGIGPGNFTGTRISVAAARGLALGLGIPAVGVSRFDSLRLGAQGPCACTVAAPRQQVYLQHFDGAGPNGTPQIMHVDELADVSVPVIGAGGQPARYPLGEAIARITCARFERPGPRPAPLYLRPADAAPASDKAPDMLS
ncbi:MAG: tRNA (adenosine(37)-N6)-threonylcarbamoyltransferase complex dimerization subunit type 1 TsaB [Pseudomonadota bacterium]